MTMGPERALNHPIMNLMQVHEVVHGESLVGFLAFHLLLLHIRRVVMVLLKIKILRMLNQIL